MPIIPLSGAPVKENLRVPFESVMSTVDPSSSHIPIVQLGQVDARHDVIRDFIVELRKPRLAEARSVPAHRCHIHVGVREHIVEQQPAHVRNRLWRRRRSRWRRERPPRSPPSAVERRCWSAGASRPADHGVVPITRVLVHQVVPNGTLNSRSF